MCDEISALNRLVREDPRYPIEAYYFVRDALTFACDILELGACSEQDCGCEGQFEQPGGHERHLTGQELCEAIREYAINQYGFMAKIVLNQWGIHSTSDFGDIVYNMIDIGLMKKSPRDRRSHFDNVYDFDEVFQENFVMSDASMCRRVT